MGQAKARGTREQRVQEAIAAGRIKNPSGYQPGHIVDANGVSSIARSGKFGGVLATSMLAALASGTNGL